MAATTQQTGTTFAQEHHPDFIDRTVRSIDAPIKRTTNVSMWNALALGSIGASLTLFFMGKKELGIFIGLWPPTFFALKAAAEREQRGY
ncbi:MAG TPA: hypothetical protein VEF04_04355 [Blastocatellia bacterium]|nr:hypothetical protein [Blastocatellia bacterium]